MHSSPGGRTLHIVNAIFESAEKPKVKPQSSTFLQPRNLLESLMRASIEPTPVKSTLLEAASPLGSIINHPNVHPLSPLHALRSVFNPRPLVKVLDAPELQDDYYLNVLDWNRRDQLVIALGKEVHWCQLDAQIREPGNPTQVAFKESITSVRWTPESDHLIIGDKSGKIVALNCTGCRLKEMDARKLRVGCIDCFSTLAIAGGRDRQAVVYDIRIFKRVSSLVGGHQQEICGVKVSPDGIQVATGGNDNVVCVWDLRRMEEPILRYTEHLAAVKGITWSSNSRLLTGGGTADRTLKLWDTLKSIETSLCTLQTGSQVTCIEVSEALPGVFYAAHGFSDNSIQTYRLSDSNVERVKEHTAMTGHMQRVLWMVKRPAGLGEELLASASGDESIRVWRPLISGKKANPKRQRSFTDIIRSTDPEEYNVF